MLAKQKELIGEDFTIQLINQANNQPVYTSSPKCSKRTASSANVSDFAAVIRFWIQ